MIFVQVFLGALLALIVYQFGRSTFDRVLFWFAVRSMSKAAPFKGVIPNLRPLSGSLEMCKCSCGAEHPKMHTCTTCGKEHVNWGDADHKHPPLAA